MGRFFCLFTVRRERSFREKLYRVNLPSGERRILSSFAEPESETCSPEWAMRFLWRLSVGRRYKSLQSTSGGSDVSVTMDGSYCVVPSNAEILSKVLKTAPADNRPATRGHPPTFVKDERYQSPSPSILCWLLKTIGVAL
ncbi:hypothetical protein AVEN_95291-1 [Araneus ventricosus]|uniref:Uncharacterized protein n=1 Tax=Araneus ventricosus TaxID=182803 RepID=A0A4Y2RJG1_ARAVE|nr:hypothetical protein AVEN_95291-1 [Araneus ventricosus]